MVEKKLFSTKSLDALVIISTLSSLILQCYTVEAKKRKQCYKEVKMVRWPLRKRFFLFSQFLEVFLICPKIVLKINATRFARSLHLLRHERGTLHLTH